MQAPNIVAQVLERMLPVGSIVEWAPVYGGDTDLSTPAKVAAYYGFGTWEAYGAGRFLLGTSEKYTPVGATGGEETHKLTNSELPSYTNGATYTGNTNAEKLSDWISIGAGTNIGYGSLALGNDQPHNNMPPYITIYRWRRIA